MITKELIDRINYLAKKKRETGLTPEENQEQSEARRQYLDGIKDQLRPMLEGLKEEPGKAIPHNHKDKCTCGQCKH